MRKIDINDYLNALQSDLDNQLSQFDINSGLNPDGAEMVFKFCPECGTKVVADANFCPNCGYNFNATETDTDAVGIDADATESVESEEFHQESDENEGIIWTNTEILSRKYGVDRDQVLDILKGFIDDSEGIEIVWHLLDMADYQDELGEATWMDYSDVLQQYIKDEGIVAGPHLSLFIIGGNDVIPQPAEANPCYSPSPWSDGTYEDHVFADFYYCFYGQLPLDFLDFNKARCNVARLPLETGEMNTSIEEDLQDYFDRSIDVSRDDGIKIGRAVMTSNSDWIPASREMSRNLPTECLKNEENVVLDNMFLSPDIMEDMDPDLDNFYCDKLSDADMLMFNLHGACGPEDSGFYSTDLAFSIGMLHDSNAPIFNTVACWGGRYIRYKREQSMLLSALYGGGVLLYSGSCVPALGKCGNFNNDDTWRIQPAAYSETFMGRFAEYQCLGVMNAGEAFLKAKCDYYNSSRMVEEDEYTLGTVLMFNLYGNPKLRTKPDIDALSEIQYEDGSKRLHEFDKDKKVSIPFRKMKRTTVMQKTNWRNGTKSLISEVRGLVDNNLRAIHETITNTLYEQLGVEPRELMSVERYESVNSKGAAVQGYLYNYMKESGPVKSQIQARLDEHGKLMDAIQTK